MKNEYNSTATNTYNCYATLNAYSVNGKFRETIINPTPATVYPQLYWRLPPHKIPTNLGQQTQLDMAPQSYAKFKDYCK